MRRTLCTESLYPAGRTETRFSPAGEKRDFSLKNPMRSQRERERESGYLADVAEGGVFGGGVEEREALVFSGELVGVVDAVVAGGAEGGLVGGAVERCLAFVADVAEDLHLID